MFELSKMEKIKEINRENKGDISLVYKRKVIVLLSTYNGEQFLEELLESVISQEGVDVFILVRDDGSTDHTLDILQLFAAEHANMRYVSGENIGVIRSFNELICDTAVDQYSYVAFCDQDDVWLPGKLSSAITKIEDEDVPMLYCSNLNVVDENLCFLHMYHKKNFRFNKYTAMVQNAATGCTEVFNQKAVTLYRKGIGQRMEMHDYWMFLLCLYLGRVYYDEQAYILYRQHKSNVIGAKQKNAKAALNHIRLNNGCREAMIFDFLETYNGLLSSNDRRIAIPASNVSNSLKHRFVLFLGTRYHAYTFLVTLNFKLRVVLGKLY